MPDPPIVLDIGPFGRPYAVVLWLLLASFVLRVLGQVIVVVRHPRWLPPMKEWYSGLLSYPLLLPIQILFIVVMTLMTLGVASEAGAFGAPRPVLGAWLVWLSYVYAGGMVARFIVWLRRPPERRRAWIPIIFHVVLAAFLWVFGSWHLQGV
ncbi:MAG TPA: hypothetical protein VMM18_14260 [Gemmatimonadaceae bacterium]|nr:hypothetical protein [Gemmatimonadaceae bacterium]